jgi:glycosyltransferase involved in cell wall biosynthesis
MTSGIEVAICTHNGAGRLPAVLESLAGQTLSPPLWSVLVVDNGSTDDTAASALRCWSRLDVPLRIVSEPRLGVTAARQRALTEARRDFVCFCDDDNLLRQDYLEQAFHIMCNLPRAGALGGQGEPLCDSPLPDWFAAAAPGYAVGPQADMEGPISSARGYLYGAGMVIRRDAWSRISRNGFGPRLNSREGSGLSSGEDNEICLMLLLAGWKVHFSPKLVFRHLIAARKLDESYCRALYRGFGEATGILNAYRDFLLGRASARRWFICASMRFVQSWFARGIDRFRLQRQSPISRSQLRREISVGFAAGCRKNLRGTRIFDLYGEIAAELLRESSSLV